ncbi:hypothetical protein N7517_003266 [Penicillium concentricum]|uniref:Protein HGH1 homolog n=1 Tax=Penicillium concentricum TaxID=293559 RepID=A0A9W9SVI7_9EURO|nr:uncharacterized protein N7517_003266 [Penicillium concentricum]KAJ5385355.1 hypothetical protein N7517_003266 [Penicillium concentricum]
MPTELEELVEFLHHGNTQIRQIACENLVGFSTAQPELFKRHQLLPVRDLKLLVRDYIPIAKNALTILINLSSDEEVLKLLAEDEFVEDLLAKLTNVKEPNADEVAMLLANVVKSENLQKLLTLKRKAPETVSTSENAIDQLMDCFVKGAEGALNKHANFDYLSYVFADLSQTEKGRAYFTQRQDYDEVVPITKLTVFTEHKSDIRRKGIASTIKNVAFEVDSHPMLFDEDGANLLPYLLLPLAGPEELSDEDTADMLPDLQLLPPDKQRDSDPTIITTHLETLLLLTTTREGREKMRAVKVYPLIRETHMHVEDENVTEACDRLVQVLMRDEEVFHYPHTITSTNIPLRTRKLSCPSTPRRKWLPAESDQTDSNFDDCASDNGNYPEIDNLPSDVNPDTGIVQRFRAFMSRAPLLPSTPALGASSYGALRSPDDSEEDISVSRRRNVRRSLQRASFENGIGSSSNVPGSTPRRSHSSVRRRNSVYADIANRRPSSATSDVGMGPDSKYSFATGLAVPANPVMQETPAASSPYMTSDDENVLDIDDDDSKSSGEDPPDNSPYAQVRASVPATDDITLSINTPRMWILSLLFSLTGSAANLFFSLRYPSVAITPIIALVLVHPLGKFWDVLLKQTGDPLEIFENGSLHHRESLSGEIEVPPVPLASRIRLWFAQGRWNEKEHACVYISSNVSFGFAFATDVIVEQHKFYNQDVPIMYQLLLIISTQVLGYAFAGLTRRFLVRPSAMIWPGTLMSTAMFSTMHKSVNKKANGWSISRYKFFVVVWAGAFLWYFVPGLLMPALSYFNVITWLAPKNVVVSNLFGVASGLGMFPLTFDWAQIAYIGSPLLTPWWAAANIVTGLVVVIWIVAPILYYKNVLFSAYMPIVSTAVFDNAGRPYDVSRILTADFLFDEKAYQDYSPVYLPITYVLSYGVQFAALTSLVTHTICWYGKDIWQQTRKAFEEKREVPDMETYQPLRRSNDMVRQSYDIPGNSSHEPSQEIPLGGDDVHCRLMRRYKDAPLTWYLLVFISMLATAIFTVEYSAQGIKFSSDLKLGHYMKIPPRILFGVQMMATLVSSLTQIGVLNWMFTFVPGLCTPEAINGFNCPIARVHFNGSILWGVVGPQRFFGPGGLYRPLVWAFLMGAVAPLGAWLLGRHSKKSFWRMVNFPILFGSLSWIPPATGLNFSIWALVCFVFNYVIRRRRTAWWEKYAMTLSAALDSGLAFAVVVVFFAFIYPGWVDGFKWWGTEIYKQGCDWIACPYKPLEPGQRFEPPGAQTTQTGDLPVPRDRVSGTGKHLLRGQPSYLRVAASSSFKVTFPSLTLFLTCPPLSQHKTGKRLQSFHISTTGAIRRVAFYRSYNSALYVGNMSTPTNPSNARTPTGPNGAPLMRMRRPKAADPLVRPKRRPAPKPAGATPGHGTATKTLPSRPQTSNPQTIFPSERPMLELSNNHMSANGFSGPLLSDKYFDYPVVTTKRALMEGLKHHIARFASKKSVDPRDESQFTRPVRLHRRDPRSRNHDPNSGRTEIDGQPMDEAEREAFDARKAAREKERAENLSQIAPALGSTSKRPNAPKQKTQQVFKSDMTPEEIARARIKYEEALPWHLEDFDNQHTWVGNYEAALSETHAVFILDNGKMRMIPAEKWYKFNAKSNFKALTIDEAEKFMAKRVKDPRWFMEKQQQLEQEKELETYAKQRKVYAGKQGTATKGAGLEAGEMDFEEDRFADDEEHDDLFNEDEDAKDAEKRIKEDQLKANVFNLKDEKEYDAEEMREKREREARRVLGKGVRKALKKRERNFDYSSGSDVNPYTDEESSDDSETERAKEEERKKAEEEKAQKEATSSKGTNTPSGRPKHTDALKKPSRKRLGSPNASDASGTDTSRKKVKSMHLPTSQPPSRPISPSALQGKKRVRNIPGGAGSGSDVDTVGSGAEMTEGGKIKKLKLNPSTVASRGGTPQGSRAASPLPRLSGSRANSPDVPRGHRVSTPISGNQTFPTAGEIHAAIPASGILSSDLLKVFRPRIGESKENHRRFIAIVKDVSVYGKEDRMLRPGPWKGN